MWTIAYYQPAALFSLKTAAATSSGGKTLLCPTPFAIKMALLDAALRTQPRASVAPVWKELRDLAIKIRLPEKIAVVNTFTKIVRPKKHGASDDSGTGLLTPLGSTIAYREYVSFGGAIGLALQTARGEPLPAQLHELFQHINYFGKRGSFVQLLGPPEVVTDQAVADDQGWTTLTLNQPSFNLSGTLQLLDDCGPKLTLEQVDIYSGKRMSLGKDRILRHIVLPYRMTRSGRGFSLYERI
jgi:hypothetical protein